MLSDCNKPTDVLNGEYTGKLLQNYTIGDIVEYICHNNSHSGTIECGPDGWKENATCSTVTTTGASVHFNESVTTETSPAIKGCFYNPTCNTSFHNCIFNWFIHSSHYTGKLWIN